MLQILPRYIQRVQDTARNLDTLVFRGQSDARWALRSGATRRLNADGVENGGPDFLAEYLDYHRSSCISVTLRLGRHMFLVRS